MSTLELELALAAARNYVRACRESRAREHLAYMHLVKTVEQIKDEHICGCGLRVDDTHPKGDF